MARVLIIEDEEQVRSVLRREAELLGHEVLELTNGKNAEAVVEESAPDLIVTDILMPERDGIETIMAVRRAHPDLKIIAISGGGSRQDLTGLQIARRLGAAATLTKPFTIEEFAQALRSVLET